MSESLSRLADAIASHLRMEEWHVCNCGYCGLIFLASPARNHCGRGSCTRVDTYFNKKVRAPLFPEQLWQVIRVHFDDAGFRMLNRRDLANPSSRETMFVGAGLQIFEEPIERNEQPPVGPLFVPQPVIRLNYWADVGKVAGTSTSFVNLCTECARAAMPEFLHHLDLWLSLLHKLKIKKGDITIVLSTKAWHGGPFAGQCIIVEVRGIEIGDAILIDEGTERVAHFLPIVDFSFGLERIVSVVNCAFPYYVFIGPLPETSLQRNERAIDRVRTATLMCLSGTLPSSRGHGRHLRRAVADGMSQHAQIDFAGAVAHAHRYWSHFVRPLRELTECRLILESEWARARTIGVLRNWCSESQIANFAPSESTDEVIRRLISGGVSFQSLLERAQQANYEIPN